LGQKDDQNLPKEEKKEPITPTPGNQGAMKQKKKLEKKKQPIPKGTRDKKREVISGRKGERGAQHQKRRTEACLARPAKGRGRR